MIDRLRKKFIRICMVSFIAVFVVLFFAIYVVTELQTNASLDTLADIVSENNGRFPDFDEFTQENGLSFKPDHINRESPFTTRFFTVSFNREDQILSVDVGSIASVTYEEAVQYAQEVLHQSKNRGWLEDFRFKKYDTADGTSVVFVNGTDTKKMHQRFLFSASSVFIGGSMVVLLLVVLFSKRAVKPAVESYEKQKEFITDANHELKTPLTLLRTNLDIIESEIGPNEWLSDMREETNTMTGLVNQLVELTRMDEAQNKLDRTPFPLSGAVYDTADAFAAAMEKNGLTLVVKIPAEIIYNGNEPAIRRLLSILMDNAVKYCDPHGVISIALTGGKHPVLTIDNTYAAVGSTELDRLFDRFYRADKARTYGSGFGIGLSIAKAITEKHHGEIKALNIENHTMRIRVKL